MFEALFCIVGGTEIKEEFLRAVKKRKSVIDDFLRGGNTDLESETRSESDNEAKGRSNSGFKPGEIILTGAGRLQCLKVIHVFPPKWVDGKSSEDRELKTLVKKILQVFDKYKNIPLGTCDCNAFINEYIMTRI